MPFYIQRVWWRHLDHLFGSREANLQHLACHMADPHQHETSSARLFLRRRANPDDTRPSGDSHLWKLEPCLPAGQTLLGKPRALPYELDVNDVLRLRRVGNFKRNGLCIRLDVLILASIVARLHSITELELFDGHTASLGGHQRSSHEADARTTACPSCTPLCGLSGGRLSGLFGGRLSGLFGGRLSGFFEDRLSGLFEGR